MFSDVGQSNRKWWNKFANAYKRLSANISNCLFCDVERLERDVVGSQRYQLPLLNLEIPAGGALEEANQSVAFVL